MQPFDDPNRLYIAAIADTLREKPTNTAPEEPHDQHGLGNFALKFDKETEAKILEIIKSFKIPELSELSELPEYLQLREYPKPPKFTDRYFDECYALWKFPQTLGEAFSLANKPEQAPAAKPAEPVFDFDAGRAAVNQFSGGARVRKIDPSNKP